MKKRRVFSENQTSFLNSLSGKSGIYSLWKNEFCLYVGKADCLQKRLTKHLKRRLDVDEVRVWDYTSKISHLSYLGFRRLLSYYEALAINQLDPIENKQRPRLKPEMIWSLPIDAQEVVINDLPCVIIAGHQLN